jgi:hypothetical protein
LKRFIASHKQSIRDFVIFSALAKKKLGRGIVNAQLYLDRRKLDDRRVARSEFVIARCDPTTLFDLVEGLLNQIAGAVEVGAEADRVVGIASRRDVLPGASFGGKVSDPVGITSTVGQ